MNPIRNRRACERSCLAPARQSICDRLTTPSNNRSHEVLRFGGLFTVAPPRRSEAATFAEVRSC